MSNNIDEFISATEKVLECLNAAAESESGKRKALLTHDVDRVESMLQNQQALVMRLENFEKKRIQAAEEVGFGGMSADEIEVSIKDDRLRERLSPLFAQMREKADILKTLNRASLDIADMELKLLSENPAIIKDNKSGGLYDSSGRKGKGRTGGTYNGTF